MEYRRHTNLKGKGFLLASYIRPEDANRVTKADLDSADAFVRNEGVRSLTPGEVLDADWIVARFNISQMEIRDPRVRNGRFFTTASLKYSNSQLGGHIAVNARPQFTRYSDIRPRWNPTVPKRKITKMEQPSAGVNTLGRYYSEAIDDNAQLIYLTFGVKKFNGLLSFLIKSVDYGDQIVANTGRPPFFYNIGRGAGGFVMFACFPITSLLIYSYRLIRNIANMDRSYDYYYMTPTMHTYWAAVTTIVNHFATEIGLIHPVFEKSNAQEGQWERRGFEAKLDPEDLKEISKLMGKYIYNSDTGYLDIYGIVTRPQVNYLNYLKYREDTMESLDDSLVPLVSDTGTLNTEYDPNNIQMDYQFGSNYPEEVGTFQAYLSSFVKNSQSPWSQKVDKETLIKIPARDVSGGSAANDIANSQAQIQAQAVNDGQDKVKEDIANRRQLDPRLGSSDDVGKRLGDPPDEYWTMMADVAKSVAHDGGQNAIFQVEYTGQVSSSFSNDIGEISVGVTLKSVSAAAADMRFNLAGGNLVEGMGDVMGAVTDVAMGALAAATFDLSSIVATILGNAYVDIPKAWKDSSVSLPGASYRMKLISPYGNVYSQMQNIYIPLSMLLAGVLPLSAGPASYTSPFLCSLYSQGVQNIKLGMITSLSISAGTSNLGFTQDRRPLAIDVDFTVTDFSNIVAAPISKNVFADIFGFGYDDEGPLGRYLSTLAGRDVQVSKYWSNKLGMRLRRMKLALESSYSPARTGDFMGNAVRNLVAPFVVPGNFGIHAAPGSRKE